MLGFFFIVSLPLAIMYYRRHRSVNTVKVVQISKEQMDLMFPSKNFSGEKNDLCSICLDELENKLCRELVCMHFFHEDCIDEWVASDVHCPICKQDLINQSNKIQIEKEQLITAQA